jgi:hypothetical protein
MQFKKSIYAALAVVALSSTGCNTPPTAPKVLVTPASPLTTEEILISVDEPSVDEQTDQTITYSYKWFQDGVLRSDLVTATVPAAMTKKGEVWSGVMTPSDGVEEGRAHYASVTVVNTPPTLTVSIMPTSPLSRDGLAATVFGSDDDSDDLSYRYAWFKDGKETKLIEKNVPYTETSKGQVWSVTATVLDDESEGASASAEVVILNTEPELLSLVISPALPTQITPLTALHSVSDADADSIAYDYVWTVDGTSVANNTPMLGTSNFASGQVVAVTVTPQDDQVSGSSLSASVVIGNTPPSFGGVSVEPAVVFEDSSVTCTPTGWTDVDGDTKSFALEWFVDGVSATTTATIDGSLFDKHAEIYCAITPFDDEGDADTVVSSTLTVQNSIPSINSATLSNTAPYAGEALSVSVAGALDIDPIDTVAYTYNWYVNGVEVSTAPILPTGLFIKDDQIYVNVTPFDGDDYGLTIQSDFAVALNSIVSLDGVTVSPATLYTDSTAVANVSSTDLDGDVITYNYAWSVNSVVVQEGSDNALLGADWFDKGDIVSVTVTPNDGDVDGLSLTSAASIVANSVPTNFNVNVTPNSPVEGVNDLTCLLVDESIDADEDALSYTFSWTLDGVAHVDTLTTTYAGDTISLALTEAEQVWICSVFASDGTDTSAIASDGVLVRLNTADIDGDGFQAWEDCDDDDDTIYPGAPEIAYDGIDQNCDGEDAIDADHDGFANDVDCDDYQPSVNSAAVDIIDDLIDQNCDGVDGQSLHFSGIATNIDQAELTGWEVCYSDTFADIYDLPDLLSDCDGEHLMLSCRPTGSTVLSVAAYTDFDDTLVPAGTGDVGNISNGVEWYFDESYSWGFVEPGDGMSRDSCDTYTGSRPDKRLCFHTNTNRLVEGYRCGVERDLNESVDGERVFWSRSYPAQDTDGDGFTADTDCDDSDSTVHPRAGDTSGDGLDQDCDGLDCDATWVDDSYFVACATTATANEAQVACEGAGYNGLASLHDGSDQAEIEALMSASPSDRWIGLEDPESDGTFLWSDGTSVDYTNWDLTQPNNVGGDPACAALSGASYGGAWSDENCEDSLAGFVCGFSFGGE